MSLIAAGLAISHVVVAAVAWYAGHKTQIASLIQAATELGGSALETFSQIQAQAKTNPSK